MDPRLCKSEAFLGNQGNSEKQYITLFHQVAAELMSDQADQTESDHGEGTSKDAVICLSDESDDEMDIDKGDQNGNMGKDEDGNTSDKQDCFQSVDFASMNKNSNGKVSSLEDVANQHGDGNMATEGDKSLQAPPRKEKKKRQTTLSTVTKANMKKIKAICMGQTALKPIGLSLSGSGMELYVNLDPNKHKALLGPGKDTKGSKMTKAKKKSKLTKTTVTSQAGDMFAHTRAGREESTGTFSSHQVFKAPMFVKKKSTVHHHENGVNVEEEGFNRVQTSSEYPIITVKDEVDNESYADANIRSVKANKYQTVETEDTFYSDSTRLYQANESDKTTYPATVMKKARPSLNHVKDSGWKKCASDFKVPEIPWNKRKQPVIFTSKDLPLKPLHSPKDSPRVKTSNLRKANVNNHRRVKTFNAKSASNRHTFLATSSSNVAGTSSYEMSGPSKNDDQSMPDDDYDIDEQMNNDSKYVASRDFIVVPSQRQTVEKLVAENNNADASPMSVSLPAFEIPESGMDDAAIAKFIEYTNSMRKDLKNNYKKISGLLKDFNKDVQEHYKTSDDLPSSHGSDNSQPEDSRNRKTCIIM